ncbi:MAG TPA: prepilin-type N-terminal cleavage/methylation domain-containing protein [Planctomycetota bacterium]|nr:prepilin-type N-terminal cleavage/methylation domain-containing protein [Planctomycetota bacterium]
MKHIRWGPPPWTGRQTAGRPGDAPRSRRGFSLVELAIAMVILLVALLGFSKSIVSSSITSEVAHESALATEASRQVLETLRGLPFDEVYARFNTDPADDPGGANTAPGAGFAVEGLEAVEGDADGFVGEIVFPTTVTMAGLELREDVVLPALGMPRDLTGDNAVDAICHCDDYELLPVLVRLAWRGSAGPARAEFRTYLTNF